VQICLRGNCCGRNKQRGRSSRGSVSIVLNFQNPGSTRFDIWTGVYGDVPREDSSAADLYKFLIRKLSTGGVVRQERDINTAGQFVRKRRRNVRKGSVVVTYSAKVDGR
jgi:hypothetical protein